MTVVEAVQAELEGLGAPGALAAAAVDLARRLDGSPGDDAAVRLLRELRQTMAEVRAFRGGGESELDRFIAELSAAPVRNTSN
jgi:hypothetical protein